LKRKVLILGSTGLIGHQVFNYLDDNSNFTLSNISYRKKLNDATVLVDAQNLESLIKEIKFINPDYIINCIGVLINQSNKDPQSAIFINAYLPYRLLSIANQLGAKLIHMSTDCVFSGDKKEPYVELDFKDGKDVYAKTKGLGEIVTNNHLTLRTSVVGPELKSEGGELFNWFMSQTTSIDGYSNAIWSGVTTIELAKAVNWAIINDITGLYHITNNQSISKNDLLNLFKRHTKKIIEIKLKEGRKTNKSFVDSRGLIDYEIPSYDQMIYDMVKFISNNSSIYPHYNNY